MLRPTSEAVIWNTYGRWLQSLPGSAHALQPMGERRAVGAAATAVPAHERVPVAGGPHRPRDGAGGGGGVPADPAPRSTPTPSGPCWRCPRCWGERSARERFPGAVETFTIEAMMRRRQGAAGRRRRTTWATNFARAYDVTYTGRGRRASTTPTRPRGAHSTRLVGAVVMTHGDDRGLRLPPTVAPHQVVVIPMPAHGEDAEVLAAATRWWRSYGQPASGSSWTTGEHLRPGAKFFEWELKGGAAPASALGARDLAGGEATGGSARSPSSRGAAAPRPRWPPGRSSCWARSTSEPATTDADRAPGGAHPAPRRARRS